MGKQEQRMQNTRRIVLPVRCCDTYPSLVDTWMTPSWQRFGGLLRGPDAIELFLAARICIFPSRNLPPAADSAFHLLDCLRDSGQRCLFAKHFQRLKQRRRVFAAADGYPDRLKHGPG